jgi:SOS-response transcriptional repressor LexA
MFVIDQLLRFPQYHWVLTHDQILAELRVQVASRKFTQKSLSDHLRIAPARVTEVLKGERRIQQDEMPKVAEWLGMSEISVEEAHILEGAIPITSIPLLGEVPGGPWREAVHSCHNYIPAPQPGIPKSAYALKVSGDSMDKVVRDGATIIIDPEDRDLFDKWLYVVRNDDGEVTFKQYRENPARLVPCSKNPDHKITPVSDRDYDIIGRVILITMSPDQAALD